MKITQAKGNAHNGISGTRISVYDWRGKLVDRWEISVRDALKYCEDHPGGAHAARLARAIKTAERRTRHTVPARRTRK